MKRILIGLLLIASFSCEEKQEEETSERDKLKNVLISHKWLLSVDDTDLYTDKISIAPGDFLLFSSQEDTIHLAFEGQISKSITAGKVSITASGDFADFTLELIEGVDPGDIEIKPSGNIIMIHLITKPDDIPGEIQIPALQVSSLVFEKE